MRTSVQSHPLVGVMAALVMTVSAGNIVQGPITLPNVGGVAPQITPDPSITPATPPPSDSYSVINSERMAQRFLATATFGGTQEEIEELVGRDAADWLAEQFNEVATSYVDRVTPLVTIEVDRFFAARADDNYHENLFWEEAITANDQLRQRALFALSQIVVLRGQGKFVQRYSPYMDNLYLNAFGNYRDLLQDITYTAAMGDYLTYEGNRKADPNTGRLPDENYAREILQLFSIGLIELNQDGTPKTLNDETIDTFNNDDIVNLARVFTGLRYDRDLGSVLGWTEPMRMQENWHSEAEKDFLDTVIPAGTDGNTSISLALDGIFAHDNVPPFLARQLIQRFTMSNPSPQYVERVANAFANGLFEAGNGLVFGTGQRGDLKATIAAVLLDPLMFRRTVPGKLREPVLRFVHMVRGLETGNIVVANEVELNNTDDAGTSLGQQAFRSPSVFNFYRPGYVAPNTESGVFGYTAPELQTVNGATSIGYINFMSEFVLDRSRNNDTGTFTPNYDPFLALVDDTSELLAYTDKLFTGGRLPAEDMQDYMDIVDAMPMRTGDNQDYDLLRRVQVAILLVTTSPTFAVLQ